MKMSYSDYAKKNGYALTRRQLSYWARMHKKAVEENDVETKEWVENLLTYINYHAECTYFKQSRYEKAINKIEVTHRNFGKKFLYRGLIVVPYGIFKNGESRTKISWNNVLFRNNFDYEEFYKVVEKSQADVFMIKGYPDLYVPVGGGLVTIDAKYVTCKISKQAS